MAYAFDDFRNLVFQLPEPCPPTHPLVLYICAMISELAYAHVPQLEIDANRRAKVLPCFTHDALLQNNFPTDVRAYLRQLDFEKDAFVVVNRNVVAIGISVRNLLFIGFRGTLFLYDWRINLDSSLCELSSRHNHFGGRNGGRAHRGFAEESIRVMREIHRTLEEQQIDFGHVFLAGHSLGGAVAALSADKLHRGSESVCMFGAPRYCDVGFLDHQFLRELPVQVQRRGDLVPLLPPRWMGYADHPVALSTDGGQDLRNRNPSSVPHFLWQTALFVGRRFAQHDIGAYRRELGRAANVTTADFPLVPYPIMRANDSVE